MNQFFFISVMVCNTYHIFLIHSPHLPYIKRAKKIAHPVSMRLFFKFLNKLRHISDHYNNNPRHATSFILATYNPFPEDAAFRLSSIRPVLTQAIIALKELFFKALFLNSTSIPYFFHFCCVNIYIFIKKDEKMAKFMKKTMVFPFSSSPNFLSFYYRSNIFKS